MLGKVEGRKGIDIGLNMAVSRTRARTLYFLGAVLVAKVAVAVYLAASGFVSVSADEFARGLVAVQWARSPRFNLVADISGIWLPLEKYLNGVLLMIWPDAYVTPRVSTFVASCVLAVVVYVWVYRLYGRIEVAEIATLLVIVQPWYLWLSSTPMLEMYYLPFVLGGLMLMTRWLRRVEGRDWLYAGCCLLVASGFHVQSWTFINLLNLLTVGYWVRFAIQQRWGPMAKLSGFYLLGNGLILLFTAIEYVTTGSVFGFLSRHAVYSKWFYAGYGVSFWEKFLYYPNLVAEHVHIAVFVLAVVGLWWTLRTRSAPGQLLPLGLGLLALLLNSALNVVSVPPTAAPGRYSLFYLLLLAPYAAYGVDRLMEVGRTGTFKFVRMSAVTVALLATLLITRQGLNRLPDFPQGVLRGAVDAGYFLKDVLGSTASEPEQTFMVELVYWDFLGVELASGHDDRRVYDRVYDIFDRDKPSMLWGEPDQVRAELAKQHVRYLALRDHELAAHVTHLPYVNPLREFGTWRVYAVTP